MGGVPLLGRLNFTSDHAAHNPAGGDVDELELGVHTPIEIAGGGSCDVDHLSAGGGGIEGVVIIRSFLIKVGEDGLDGVLAPAHRDGQAAQFVRFEWFLLIVAQEDAVDIEPHAFDRAVGGHGVVGAGVVRVSRLDVLVVDIQVHLEGRNVREVDVCGIENQISHQCQRLWRHEVVGEAAGGLGGDDVENGAGADVLDVADAVLAVGLGGVVEVLEGQAGWRRW